MDTKQYITETAFKLFIDKGFKNTSMSDLVKATKLSKGAVYHHFANKEKLYFEVIDTYFLSYIKQFDMDVYKNLPINEIEQMIKEFYLIFIPEIISITKKGMSRYFIMFFEAYDLYPKFKLEIREFYLNLKKLIISSVSSSNSELEAIRLIAKYEGLIFWISVFPEENIDKLITEF